MLYSEFINKATDLTIEQADNGMFYLEPMWKNILISNKLNIKLITDYKTDWHEIENVLKLTVEKRNTTGSNNPFIINWLFDIITAKVEPAILSEETDYIKQVTEFMRENHALEKSE